MSGKGFTRPTGAARVRWCPGQAQAGAIASRGNRAAAVFPKVNSSRQARRIRYTAGMRVRSSLPLFLFPLCLLMAGQAAAKEAILLLPQGLAEGEDHRVAEVIDGDSLLLEDGRVVHLSGIQAPMAPPDATPADAKTWPLALEAAAALTALMGDGAVTLAYGWQPARPARPGPGPGKQRRGAVAAGRLTAPGVGPGQQHAGQPDRRAGNAGARTTGP